MMYQVLAIILIVYGLFLIVSGFAKFKFMIKFAKAKLGKNANDETTISFLYISGGVLMAGGVILLLYVLGVF